SRGGQQPDGPEPQGLGEPGAGQAQARQEPGGQQDEALAPWRSHRPSPHHGDTPAGKGPSKGGSDWVGRGGGRFTSQRFVGATGLRSEEHTSELQSREKLVCRLLLEKK